MYKTKKYKARNSAVVKNKQKIQGDVSHPDIVTDQRFTSLMGVPNPEISHWDVPAKYVLHR